jgi:hypothetical protein
MAVLDYDTSKRVPALWSLSEEDDLNSEYPQKGDVSRLEALQAWTTFFTSDPLETASAEYLGWSTNGVIQAFKNLREKRSKMVYIISQPSILGVEG